MVRAIDNPIPFNEENGTSAARSGSLFDMPRLSATAIPCDQDLFQDRRARADEADFMARFTDANAQRRFSGARPYACHGAGP
jgi:hypothetical protein